MGGLGNQMFQYAFSKALGDQVLFDLSYFARKKEERHWVKYALGSFNADLKFATNEEIKKCLSENKLAELYTNIYKISGIKLFPTNRTYEKVRNQYQPDLQNIDRDNVYYDGYFVNEKYFLNYRKELLYDFSLKYEMEAKNNQILQNIMSENSVAVSVRRGADYVKLGWALERDYYLRSINEIAEKIENPHFYLFTDNSDWCFDNIKIKYPLTICNSYDMKNGYAAGICLIKHCKHAIISNSTYAWWGAWLNENPNKIIIAPEIWFKNSFKLKRNTIDVIPDSWIKR